VKVIVCSSCALGAGGFAGPLENALAEAGVQADVAGVVCMSGCARPSTVAFRAAGKTAYLFGDLTAGDLPELVQFARRYAQSPDGEFVDARPLGQLRFKALARIPGDLSESGGMCRKSP
jgi:predicted metal-binding protein